MATSSRSRFAKVTIPSEYLEDLRPGLIEEISMGADALRHDQAGVLAGEFSGEDNRTMALHILHLDMALLDELVGAIGDTTITTHREAFSGALDAMVRVISGRLAEKARYHPVDMPVVLDLAARLRWAGMLRAEVDNEIGAES
jgi:hypothetical protein